MPAHQGEAPELTRGALGLDVVAAAESSSYVRHRFAVVAYDALAALAVAFVFTFAYVKPAYAYVDPSVMTYAIQAVAGVAVALSTVFGVVFRRTRKALLRALGIDENARRVLEARLHRVDESGRAIETDFDIAMAARKANTSGKRADGLVRTWKGRLVLSLIAAVFTSFTLFVVAPCELVSASAGSLVVRLANIWPIVAAVGLLLALVLTLVLFIIPKRAFDIALAIVFSFGVCCYIQALFMNGGLPQADGGVVDWSAFSGISAASTFVWVALIAAIVVLAIKLPSWCQLGIGVLSVALVLVQGAAVVSLFASESESMQSGSSGVMVSQKGLLDVSANENVIEFVLDNYDTSMLQTALSVEPSLLDSFTDFVWFQDSVGSMIPTRYGNVFLLTGQYPQVGENFSTFLANRYARSSYLSDIQTAGYSIGIYSDTLGDEYLTAAQAEDQIYRYTENIVSFNNEAIDSVSTAVALMQCALYRDMPWLLKPIFWFTTDEVNNRIVNSNQSDASLTPYLMNDGELHNRLNAQGLSTNEERASYRYIHILGDHSPYSLDREGNDIGQGVSNKQDQAIGSMKIVRDYINQLKELGLYDSATIIVTSDHGDWWLQNNDLTSAKSPILLAKPGSSSGSAAGSTGEGLRVSSASVSASDILPTVLDAVGSSDSGETLFSLDEAARSGVAQVDTRYFYMTTSDGAHDVEIQQYAINGDARDISNWSRTGIYWPAQE